MSVYFFEKKNFMDQKKYAGLGLLNIVGIIRVYATYHPSSIYYSVFVIFVFSCVFPCLFWMGIIGRFQGLIQLRKATTKCYKLANIQIDSQPYLALVP